MESFEISEFFAVKPERLYAAWLDGEIHGKMVGGADVLIEPKVNGKFGIWKGYITGTLVELVPYKKIIQKWRTLEFPEDSPDSLVELDFIESDKGTRLVLSQKDIPDDQGADYREGWKDYYFLPMKKYFG